MWKRICMYAAAMGLLTGLTACHGQAFTAPVSGDGDADGDTDSETDTLAALLGIGDPCETSADCTQQIICSSVDHTCQYPGSPGTLPEDAPCMSNDYCEAGLVCSASATCQPVGDPGTLVAGEECEDSSDCVLGLICDAASGVCKGYQMAFWSGVECEEPPAEPETFESYFDVRREAVDYYALPFPNDAAKTDGRIDLTGHGNPGVLVPELGNPVDRYFSYIENELDGFGMNTHVYFRFNQTPDWDTVVLQETVYIVNIDPDSPEYGQMEWTGYSANSARGMYICHNWLALKPSFGVSLNPDTTYAAILTTGLRNADGAALQRSVDFNAMMANGAPADPLLADAWAAYAPLRDYVVDQGVNAAEIANATVFTTQTAPLQIPALRAAVRSEPAPVLVDNAMTADTDADVTVFEGKITVPFYQQGVRPFKSEGGNVEWNSSGEPVRVEDDEVAFALTVPGGAAPAEGWPVFMYAHGTGGSQTSFIDEGIAEALAGMGCAAVSLLQVQHGERRQLTAEQEGQDGYDEGSLFYNFANPYAAVGNNLQAAADYFQLVRFLESFATITGEGVAFDTNRIFFFGHSQGTQGQFIAAVHDPLVKGIVISGAGGYLMESLLGKKQPVDVATGIKYVLMDPNVDITHPVLNLIQAAMEQVDPINHVGAAYRSDWPDQVYPHRNVFMAMGIDDSYAPERTQLAMAKALRLQVDTIAGHEIPGSYEEIGEFPVTETNWIGSDHLTAVGVQYEPGDYDGHFVIFHNDRAIAQWTHFASTMIAGAGPAELIDGQ